MRDGDGDEPKAKETVLSKSGGGGGEPKSELAVLEKNDIMVAPLHAFAGSTCYAEMSVSHREKSRAHARV